MAKLVIGPIDNGLRRDRTAFNIDNDSFPTLLNAYQWRGRVKRKRGTGPLNRLRRFFDSLNPSYGNITTITLNGSGQGNLISGFGLVTGSQIYATSGVGAVEITAPGPTIYTDNGDGTLSPSGTINYATGDIQILAEAGNAISVTLNYFPVLPGLGFEDLDLEYIKYPGSLAFDTQKAYNVQTVFPYTAYNVSFYKNPAISPDLPGYTPKTNVTPLRWNGEDYRQFWSINYQNAFWVTNGVNVPFNPGNFGMQFKPIISVTITSGGPPAIVTLNIIAHGLSVGDFLFINEVGTTTGINFQTGYVISVIDANNVSVEFPQATIATNGTGGIAQYLTNNSDTTKDCIRWYDGDPTSGNPLDPTLDQPRGWVNFMPPLSISRFNTGELPLAQYYLVGAKLIANFKDRLLFLGPVVQSSSGNPIYLEDTVIYSQNGVPYYTASFTGNQLLVTTPFSPILVPQDQTSSPNAFIEDQPGYGGYINAGEGNAIISVSSNEDVLICGFETLQARLIYTGNDIIPFEFYTINSEYNTSSTFSVINLDKGVLSRGTRGFIITGQTQVSRIDLKIPNEVYEMRLLENGAERMCAARDFQNEWVYFTFPQNGSVNKFPTRTLFYNYRDDSWAIFFESYTTYGLFRKQTGYTWGTIGTDYSTWGAWNTSWGSGGSTLLNPQVVGGNQQGFLMIRDESTDEAASLYIKDITGNVVNSPFHCLNEGDYIVITDVLGTVSSEVNGKVFSVYDVDQNEFKLKPPIVGGTYLGNGLIKRLYRPLIQTKQFPMQWEDAKKTRLGPQRYLLTKTSNAQIELQIYLSQNGATPYNYPPFYPDINADNDGIIYSDVLFTCPESTNIGLTPSNINLNTPNAINQSQIWHRISTSLIGDTVQLGFTLSDTQMRTVNDLGELISQVAEIELHSIIFDVFEGPYLV